MRYLLTIAILLMATSSFAVLTKTYTVCEGGGCDYTTVGAAESAHNQDLVANDSALTFEIQNTWVSSEGNWTVAGWTTDATRFLTITAVGAARATATFSTTAYRAIGNAPILVSTGADFTVIDGLQTKVNSSGDNCISFTSPTNCTVKNCFFSGDGQSSSRGIIVNGASITGTVVRNNVVIDCVVEGIFIVSAATGGVKVDNNTIENCGDGIQTSVDDGIARNNILLNCTTPLVGDFNTTTLSEENWTDAASLSYGACGSCGTGDQLSQSDPFVDLGGENYSLASGSTPIDAGKDLSGDFTDAIGGKTRDANFDKGADEFIAAGGTTLEGVTLEGVTIE